MGDQGDQPTRQDAGERAEGAGEVAVDTHRLERTDAPELSVAELQAILGRGDPVVVFDVRPAIERAEWAIPGSVYRDAYAALRRGEPDALAGVELPAGIPIVAVCGAGRASEVAAAQLRDRGHAAFTLAGGMKAWSLAWNTAEIASPAATLLQVRRTGKGCLSYILGSRTEAAAIDPSLDAALYLRLARARGWTIRHVLDTHIHADHLSRARAVAEAAGADLWLPEQRRVRFPHRTLRDGESLRVGDATLRAIHTPGHTDESTCYLADERWLLTGDTLFPASVGRPDLEATAEEARTRASILHDTLRRLLALDPELSVLACHASAPVPFDRVVLDGTIGGIRAAIPLVEDAGEFVEDILRRLPAAPPNCHTIVGYNEAGLLPSGDVTDLEAGPNNCAIT